MKSTKEAPKNNRDITLRQCSGDTPTAQYIRESCAGVAFKTLGLSGPSSFPETEMFWRALKSEGEASIPKNWKNLIQIWERCYNKKLKTEDKIRFILQIARKLCSYELLNTNDISTTAGNYFERHL